MPWEVNFVYRELTVLFASGKFACIACTPLGFAMRGCKEFDCAALTFYQHGSQEIFACEGFLFLPLPGFKSSFMHGFKSLFQVHGFKSLPVHGF